MPKYIHIDSNVHILTDEEARQALERENDQEFLTEDQGIVRVPRDRWQTAQTTERKHWMNLGIGSDTDRNQEHFSSFGGYEVLAGESFAQAIELGCGPFTNLRLIADVCRVGECTLLDPLIESYLSHPNRAYSRSTLTLENTRMPQFLGRLQRKVLRHLPGMRQRLPGARRIPVARLLAVPIEEMPTDRCYNLLVIINVIEHCYDIEAVFTKILAVLEPGAVLVFHEPLFDHAVIHDRVETLYDAAHPLQVDRAVILSFLHGYFTPLFEQKSFHPNVFEGEDLSFEGIFFIGRKN
jgi:SAM-dependent methyltransferase